MTEIDVRTDEAVASDQPRSRTWLIVRAVILALLSVAVVWTIWAVDHRFLRSGLLISEECLVISLGYLLCTFTRSFLPGWAWIIGALQKKNFLLAADILAERVRKHRTELRPLEQEMSAASGCRQKLGREHAEARRSLEASPDDTNLQERVDSTGVDCMNSEREIQRLEGLLDAAYLRITQLEEEEERAKQEATRQPFLTFELKPVSWLVPIAGVVLLGWHLANGNDRAAMAVRFYGFTPPAWLTSAKPTDNVIETSWPMPQAVVSDDHRWVLPESAAARPNLVTSNVPGVGLAHLVIDEEEGQMVFTLTIEREPDSPSLEDAEFYYNELTPKK